MDAFIKNNLIWTIVVVGLLFVGICILAVRLVTIKVQMRRMTKELIKNRDGSYNKQMTVTLMDEDLTKLASEYNKSLDYQKELKLEAEHSRKQLQQSVSDIAHDLRTPVTVMKGNLQRLMLDGHLSDKDMEYVRICNEKTDTLRTMIDEFFELSFYESELNDVPLKRMDLTNFAAQFFVDQEAVIREKGIEPDIILPPKSLFIMADEQLLSRMFGNLLNNIMRHTKEGFSFFIGETWEEETQQRVVKISFANPVDPGNVPDTEHIFERTYRGDKARTGGGVGGLGLYIVKLLAEKQRARVKATIKPEATIQSEVTIGTKTARRPEVGEELSAVRNGVKEILDIEIFYPVAE